MKTHHWKTGSFLFVLVLLACLKVSATTEQIYSPDKDIRVDIHAVDNTLEAEIFKGDVHLVRNIRLGLTLNGSNFDSFKVTGKKRSHFSDTWRPVWGKQSEVRNEYNRFIFSVKDIEDSNRKMNIIFRVYDDGVALRYEIPEQSSPNEFVINKDLTSFAVARERSFYTPNGERANIGPVRVSGVKEQFTRNEDFQTPMVFVSDDSHYLAVHEAATFDFSYSRLKSKAENRFQFDMESSTGKTSAKTAWRVFMIGDNPGELLASNLLYNLNPSCAIEDPSWIKPGVSLWDWRARGAQVDGFTYEISQEAFMRYVDFAAEKDIEYVLFDAGWYSKKGPTHSREGMDMSEIIRYAESKGVGVLLYLDRRSEGNNDWELEKVLKTWSQWGAKGIKYGFLGSECDGRQELVKRTRAIVKLCARYELLVNFHDHPVPPAGGSRTWPNLITREYCHAQSDARRAFQPETFVTSSIVNGISGALDMNNGYFELNGLMEQGRKAIGEPVPSTVVAEAARAFIVFSGLVVIPDHPDAYRAKADLFEFITNIRGSWDETKVIHAEIGKYISVARRKGDTWMIGSATNEKARELEINLDFLDKGAYELTQFSDGENASAFGDKEDYIVKNKTVHAGDTHHYKMAPGGGHCVLIKKK